MQAERRPYLLHLTDDGLGLLQAGLRALRTDFEGGNLTPGSRVDLENVEAVVLHAAPRTSDELQEFADDVKRRAYFEHVGSVAEEIEQEIRDGDLDMDEWTDALHERADSDAWVIYTASALDVLRYSENDGYSITEFGAEGIVLDGVVQWSVLAYGALYADVMERVDTDAVRDELEERAELGDEFYEALEEHGVDADTDLDVYEYIGEAKVADRWDVAIEVEGETHDFSMSGNADELNGVCSTTELVQDRGPDWRKVYGDNERGDAWKLPEGVRRQIVNVTRTLREEVDG